MNIYVLTAFVVFVSSAGSSKHYKPCENYKHGDSNYLKEDPRDCSKYYRCDTGGRVHHMQCSQGTSFDPNWNNGHGNCVGSDPKYIPDWYSEDDGDDDEDDDDNDDDY